MAYRRWYRDQYIRQRALAICEAVLGAGHPTTIIVRANLEALQNEVGSDSVSDDSSSESVDKPSQTWRTSHDDLLVATVEATCSLLFSTKQQIGSGTPMLSSGTYALYRHR
jgi:hypothetical protein